MPRGGEIRYPGKIYDYDAKYVYEKGETLYFYSPASLSETALKRAAETALACGKIAVAALGRGINSPRQSLP